MNDVSAVDLNQYVNHVNILLQYDFANSEDIIGQITGASEYLGVGILGVDHTGVFSPFVT